MSLFLVIYGAMIFSTFAILISVYIHLFISSNAEKIKILSQLGCSKSDVLALYIRQYALRWAASTALAILLALVFSSIMFMNIYKTPSVNFVSVFPPILAMLLFLLVYIASAHTATNKVLGEFYNGNPVGF